MKYVIIILFVLHTSCEQNQQTHIISISGTGTPGNAFKVDTLMEFLNQPMYLLDTLLYQHNAIIPANTWYTLRGHFPIWDKIEFMDDWKYYPKKPRISAKTISIRQYGDGTVDTICCGTMETYDRTYHGNLIMTSTNMQGESRAVKWNDSPDVQQHMRKVYTNYRSYLTYYTIEKIKN